MARSWAMVEGTVRLAVLDGLLHLGQPVAESAVVRGDRDRELVVLQRVVVAAVDEGLRGQGRQPSAAIATSWRRRIRSAGRSRRRKACRRCRRMPGSSSACGGTW